MKSKLPNALEVFRYIHKRMKASDVPSDAISCDALDRVTHIAERALTTHWITGKRTEEMNFRLAGKRWFCELTRI